MFRCSVDEAMGQSLDRFIPARFRAAHSSHVQSFGQVGVTSRAMAGSRAVYGLRADGEEFPVKASISQVEAGGQKLYTVIMRDITERKRAEGALGQAEEKYRSIFVNAVEGIFQTTPDGRFITANPSLARMLGYDSPDEMLSSRTDIARQQYVDPERRSEFKRLLEEHGVVWEFEHQAYRKDGSKIWLSENVRVVRDEGGAVLYYEGFTEDITEHKRADERLRQSERQLAEAQHLARLGNWNWDLRSNILTWSDEIYRIFGVDPSVFDPAYDDTFMETIHADDRALVRGVVEVSLKTREPFSVHYRIIRPDGEERVIHSRGRIASDEYGNPVRMFGTAQDVTERRQAEERLRETTEQLRALSARIHSAKEEEGTRIAREIHDELGAALTSLRWDLESVDKIIAEAGDRPQTHQLRERIGAMLRLTETTIGAIRRISSDLRPGVLDDLGLVAAIEWQAGQFQARTGITCRCDCSLENLDLDREQSTAVFRIFQEALTNVLRHAQATVVDITAKAEAGEFALKIVDNGRGITEDERMGARSLGLLGMRERAHLIGGKINISGAEGEGTVITIRVTLSG